MYREYLYTAVTDPLPHYVIAVDFSAHPENLEQFATDMEESIFQCYYSIKSQPSSSQFINIETIDRINNTIYNISTYSLTRKNNLPKLQIARKLTKPASW